MVPGKKILPQVRLGQYFVAQVGSANFGLGLALENFSLKSQIFKFFALWVKKISFGWVKKYPD